MRDASDQATLWEETLSSKWIRFRRILSEGLAAHSDSIIAAHEIDPSARVLDVGCGFGETTQAWAQKVPQGGVLGVDISRTFINLARGEVSASSNCTYEVADAGGYQFHEKFDLVYSRFGCMFFERPSAAFSNLCSALATEGQLLLQVWRAREFNPWFTEAIPAILKILPEPEGFGPSDAPGPFAMANQDPIQLMLEEAGFTEVEFEALDVDMTMGDSLESAITFQMNNGPVGQIIREAGDLAVEKEQALRKALGAVLKPFHMADGAVRMPSSSWTIRAKGA